MKEINCFLFCRQRSRKGGTEKNYRKNVLKKARRGERSWTIGGNSLQERKRQLIHNNFSKDAGGGKFVSVFLAKQKVKSPAEREDGKGNVENLSTRERQNHLSEWEY